MKRKEGGRKEGKEAAARKKMLEEAEGLCSHLRGVAFSFEDKQLIEGKIKHSKRGNMLYFAIKYSTWYLNVPLSQCTQH